MLPSKLAFIDVETTGLKASSDRIIEIGILRVEGNNIVQTYHTLVNPEISIPSHITTINGITDEDVADAPTFRMIQDDIKTILSDCLFVAHNVGFDYGFIRHEFKREQIPFVAKRLCTVKLSQLLYPQYQHHNLDSLIERFNVTCDQRHRALGDAKVLFHCYKKMQEQFSLAIMIKALEKC